MIKLEEDRRKQGEYFTPDILTLKADEYLSRYLGGNYKEEFYVWDCAAGMGNLTRNFKYAHLFQSTLHKSDIQTMEQSGINPEATKFQFDFLNDELGKLPSELMEAIKGNKKILFYMNPPYATSSNLKNLSAELIVTKDDVSKTKYGQKMKEENWGSSAVNLYAQFFYRIYKIKNEYNLSNLNIGIFCPELFLSGDSYKEFRKYFLNDFNFLSGFLTPASMFSDVASSWGILFSIWKCGKNEKNDDFKIDVFDKSNDDIELKILKDKNLYNLDSKLSLNKWLRQDNKYTKIDFPQASSSIKVKEDGNGAWSDNAIGFFFNIGNNIQSNASGQAIFTMPHHGKAQGFPFSKDMIYKVCSTFTSRKLIQSDWINQKNEYLPPDENNSNWKQFQLDSIVYSLFNSSSQQSSLRNIDYKGKSWNIFNEFFWISVDKMTEVIKQSTYSELYNDIKTFGKQRYVASLLYDQGIYDKLSEDAKFVLDRATAIVIKSIPQRKIAQEENSKLCAYAWDAGWYQIKAIIDTVKLDSGLIKDFSTVYKEFGDRLRPLVYELGFLK